MTQQPKRRRYLLKFISGKYEGKEMVLEPGADWFVGRGKELDVVLVEDKVSRKHAHIEYADDEGVSLEDLGSTNGTFVNGERVERVRLKAGDRILIGTSVVKFIPLADDDRPVSGAARAGSSGAQPVPANATGPVATYLGTGGEGNADISQPMSVPVMYRSESTGAHASGEERATRDSGAYASGSGAYSTGGEGGDPLAGLSLDSQPMAQPSEPSGPAPTLVPGLRAAAEARPITRPTSERHTARSAARGTVEMPAAMAPLLDAVAGLPAASSAPHPSAHGYDDAAVPQPDADVIVSEIVAPAPHAESGRAGRGASVSGYIEEVPLPDLLQLLSSGRKSGTLLVEGEKRARVLLRKGQIIFGAIDGQPDMDPLKALYRVMTWTRGRFELKTGEPEVPAGGRELRENTQGLVMEAARQLDEIRNLQGELPDADSDLMVCVPLEPALSALEPDQLDAFQLVYNHGRVSVIVDRSPWSDLDTYRHLMHLLGNRYVRVA